MPQFDETDQNLSLSEFRKKEQEFLAQRLADSHGLPYVDLTVKSVNNEALNLIPEKEARAGSLAAFDRLNKKVDVAVLSPEHKETVERIDELKQRGYEPSLHVASEESLKSAWEMYKDISQTSKSEEGSFEISSNRIEELSGVIKTISDIEQEIKKVIDSDQGGKTTTSVLETAIGGALSTDASDIHFEPEEESVRIRYRLDGVLTSVITLPPKLYDGILSRIKLLSGLKLNKEQAQDGRFSINYGESEIEMRTSIIPGAYGESIVLRILNPDSISVPLEELGMHPRLLEVVKREINKPHGMILTTGPTGSGKTTTLYAVLKKINSPETKILTIENPIEYHLSGVVQTQTNNQQGYTFSEGLRSALRQDPDVIMVGEIRDQETAEIAVNAALTGHLVFSTLHTNTAAGSFPRLIDLGVNPKVISSALNLSMAQRLIRKLCPDCKTKKPLEGEAKEKVEKVLNSITDKAYVEELEQTESVWEAEGCEKCNHLGYKGRVGIYEAIRATEEIEKVVINNPSERDINKAAEEQALLTMAQDGIIKVLNGQSSLSELESAVSLIE